MAKYLRSTDGNDADAGSSWALSNATMVGLAANLAAGEDGYFSQDHAESEAGTTSMTITFPGTLGSPNRIIGVSDAAEPPAALNGAGSLTRTSTSITATLVFAGSFVLVGGTYTVGSSSSSSIKFGSGDTDVQTYVDATFIVTNTSTVARIVVGASATSARASITHSHSTFKFANAAQGFSVQRGRMMFNGGGLDAAGAAITSLFPTALASGVTRVEIKNFDVSSAASTLNILGAAFGCTGSVTLNRVKLPASWTGSLFSSEPTMPDFRISMYNCDSGDTNYKLLVGDRQGTMRDETTLVMTGGASDGTTGISWKVVTSANANEALTPFETNWISQWNTSVGASKTITVEILHDSTTDLTDAEIWLEAEYLGTSGVPLGMSASGQRDALSTATPHASSTVTWTTTGLTNPRKQKLTLAFTAQEIGNVLVRLMIGKSNWTGWINPEFSIT